MVARGHILIEDNPGVGKSTLALALAQLCGGQFGRVQFTSDLLPADVLGATVWRREQEVFEFRPGPIFANVVLADEINRAPPRTQSALLEAMNDGQVTVDGRSHPLPRPFIVLATQNPHEHYGTYPLPESQRDRFSVRLHIGYADAAIEAKLLEHGSSHASANRPDLARAVASGREVDLLGAQAAADEVRVHTDLARYAQSIVAGTRQAPQLRLGVSTRGALAFVAAARARAYLHGRRFINIDDLQELAVPTLAHRVMAREGTHGPTSSLTADIVREIVAGIPAPL
ncbi:MAG: AAA family ATPase [Myxococcales bacterium FL481]|nr:MAG: AAA family ATPase [Myxococcales bacterium FL481]